jgi:hypothetical protein
LPAACLVLACFLPAACLLQSLALSCLSPQAMRIEEYSCNGYLLKHQRTGAELMSVTSADENKTFGVTYALPISPFSHLPLTSPASL